MTRREVVLSSGASTIDSDAPKQLRIDADILIPGRGNPMKSGVLVYSPNRALGGTGKIIWAGQAVHLPPSYSKLPVHVRVPVLMPGLWDCHCHYLGEAEPNLDHLAVLPHALAGARSARDVAATLNAGFTSVRELAGFGAELSKAINEGWIPGPNIYSVFDSRSRQRPTDVDTKPECCADQSNCWPWRPSHHAIQLGS